MSKLTETFVPDDQADCPLLLVGEAPGQIETQRLRPFVGPAGEWIDRTLSMLGLVRGKDYSMANACNQRPSNNDWAGLPWAVKKQQFEMFGMKIKSRRNINTIVALGDTALTALVHKRDESNNPLTFTKMRGCFWPSKWTNLRTGEPFKVMVTHHPSNVIQHRASGIELREDIEKALAYHTSPAVEYDALIWRTITSPTDLRPLVDKLCRLPAGTPIAYDIEAVYTPEGWRMDMISFATSPTTGFVVDLWSYGDDEMMQLLRPVLDSQHLVLVGQNVGFDRESIETSYGFYPTALHHDTMDMHIQLDPEAPHDLGYLSSKFCNRPYFKDEGKKYDPKKHPRNLRRKYNVTDSCTTLGSYFAIRRNLEGREDF